MLALACPAHHILYHGTRGPGKTEVQLMRFRRRVGLGYGAFWRGVIFDREYKNLEDVVAKSTRWFYQLGDGAQFTSGTGSFKWKWPTGEELLFRHIKKEKDYWLYHGHEYPFIGWNELTKYPTSELYDAMMSCNRSSFVPDHYPLADGSLLPEIPLEVFSTTNPWGAGHNWVKHRFIDVAEAGVISRNTIEVFNPRTQKREPVTRTQTHIFGSYKENRFLSPEYVAELEGISDENKREAWLYGNWDIVAGGALSDVWGRWLILPRFRIPKGWRVDRSFDWGSTHPFSVGFWAEANGEEAKLPDGSTFCPPKGSLIRIDEWYGAKELGTNKGLMLSAPEIALGIKQRELLLKQGKWIETPVLPGPADNQIRDVRESDTPTIETKMAQHGVRWAESDKAPGSRKIGLQLIRDRMQAARDANGEPAIYFMDNCRAAIGTLPTLPRDELKPDDVDTDSEDHAYDEVRYRVLAAKRRVTRTNLKL